MIARIFALFILATTAASAEFVYHDSATTDGGVFNNNANYAIGNLKNGGYTSPDDVEDASVSAAGRSYATESAPGFPVTITLDFNSAVDLTKFYLWNHSNNSAGTGNGMGDFTLTFYSGAGATGSTIGSVYSGSASAAPATGTYAAEVFDFGATYNNVRSVELVIANNIANATTSFVAIRELGFERSVNFLYHDSATTTGGEFNTSFQVGNLKNAGHTSPDGLEDAADSNQSYATTSPPTGGFPVTVTLEFNNPASLEAFHLWNHSNANSSGAPANGVGSFSLTFFDGPGGTGAQVGAPFNGSASAAPATGTYPAQSFDFGTTYAGVRSVVFKIDNKQDDSTSGFVAMREIGFSGTTAVVPPATPDRVIVYLVGGQSNADGYGVTGELSSQLQAPQPDIDFYHGNGGGNSPLAANQWIHLQPGSGSMPGNAGGFGPELNFGIGIHQALGSERARIAVIKHTVGGTNLHTQWFPGGDGTTTGDGAIYQDFQSTVSGGLASLASLYPAADIQVEGMIWHQGESDTGNTTIADNYQTNLTNFISDLRATYGAGLRFGIVQLSDTQTYFNATGLAIVKAAQATVAAADPISYLVTTDDLPSDTVHFRTVGNLAIGTRLADGMRMVPLNDSDGNGLDDGWEEEHWGTGNIGQDPDGDDDKDGINNLDEFFWLTDPLVSNVVGLQLQTSPDFIISWPSSTDRHYLIEVSDDLVSWQRLDSFLPGSAGTTSYALPVDPEAMRSFWRVGVQR